MSRVIKLAVLIGAISLISPRNPLKTLLGFAIVGYLVTTSLIPKVTNQFIKVGLKGKDLSKLGPSIEIAESMGIVPAITYLFMMFGLIPFIFFKYLVSYNNLANDVYQSRNYVDQYKSSNNDEEMFLFPHNKLAQYLSAIICLQGTIFLGLFDDLFDIRWRHKFFLPAVASLPLLIVYYVDFSVTSVVVPKFITTQIPYGDILVEIINYFVRLGNHGVTYITGLSFRSLSTDYVVPKNEPKLLDLGVFYYCYMSAISIFCPNSINILAGINGLEVGQSLVLSAIFLINDMCYLLSPHTDGAAYDSHVFSAIFLIPFCGVSLGLLKYNWYPARVFVGDTYCYFSGMVFALVGILGHFSKTLLIFFLPQIINFVYSVPQLFHLVPCPRHRLPFFNKDTQLMSPSYAELSTPPSLIQSFLLKTLNFFRLVDIKSTNNSITHFSNLTIINLNLVLFGPLQEDRLCIVILIQQFLLGLLMIFVRHTIGPWLFGYDNLSFRIK